MVTINIQCLSNYIYTNIQILTCLTTPKKYDYSIYIANNLSITRYDKPCIVIRLTAVIWNSIELELNETKSANK